MRCAKPRKYMLDIIEGELSPSMHQRLERHLRSCSKCQEEYDFIQDFYYTVKGLPLPKVAEPLAGDFLRVVRQKIRAAEMEPAPSLKDRWGWRILSYFRRPLMAYASVVIIVGLVIGGLLFWLSYSRDAQVDLAGFSQEEVEDTLVLISADREIDMELIELLERLSPEEITSFSQELEVEVEPDLIFPDAPILPSGYLNSGYFYDEISDFSPEEIEEIIQQLSVKEASYPSPKKEGGSTII